MDKGTLEGLHAFLVDVDGVLHDGWGNVIPGALGAIEHIQRRGYDLRILTNVTSRSRASVARRLRDQGFDLRPEEVFTASHAAACYLRNLGRPRCMLLVDGSGREDFYGLELTDERPDFVVVGDMDEAYNYHVLNRAFRAVMDGAGLIAIQKHRYWVKRGELCLDAGAWVAALEYATGREATVIGKPASHAYLLAAADMELAPQEVAMIDDIEINIVSAQRVGMRGVLVGTGELSPDGPPPGFEPGPHGFLLVVMGLAVVGRDKIEAFPAGDGVHDALFPQPGLNFVIVPGRATPLALDPLKAGWDGCCPIEPFENQGATVEATPLCYPNLLIVPCHGPIPCKGKPY